MAERTNLDTKAKGDASSTPRTKAASRGTASQESLNSDFSGTAGVSINRSAFKGLCLRGTPEPVAEMIGEVLFDIMVESGIARVNPDTGEKEFNHEDVPKFKHFKGTDNYPNMHDVKRWLDACKLKPEENADDIRLAISGWATARERFLG